MGSSVRNLLISFTLVIGVVSWVVWYTFSTVNSQEKEQANIRLAREVLQRLGDAGNHVQELESIRADYTGIGRNPTLDPFNSALSELRSDSAHMVKLAASPTNDSNSFKQLAGLIHHMIGNTIASSSSSAQSARAGDKERELLLVSEFRAITDKIEGENRLILNDSYNRSISLTRETFSLVRIIALLSAVILIISFYFIYHDISTKKKTGDQLKIFNEELEKQVNEKTFAIRENEEKYRRLFGSMTDAFAKVELSGKIIEFNPAFQNMLGYTDEEINRLSYQDITPTKWHKLEDGIITKQVLAKGYSDVFEKEYIHKSGKIFPVELRAFLLRNLSDEPVAIWAIIRDISERKEAETRLAESEKNLRQVLTSTSDNFYVIDRNCRVILINEAAEKNLKKAWGKAVVVGTNILDVLPQDTDEPINASLDKVFSGKDVEYELHGNSKDLPEWVLVTYRPVVNEKGAVTGAFIVAKDITEKKIADLARKESEERYKALVENAPEALVVFDLEERKFVSVSESAVKLFKMSKEELLKIGPSDLSPEYQPDGGLSSEIIMGNIARVMEGGKPSFEWTHCDSEGNPIPCEVRLVRLPSENKILIRGSIIDITERKQAEKELQKSEQRYRSVIEQASDPIMITDEKGRFVEVNSALCKKFGYAREELMQATIEQLIDPAQLKSDPIDFESLLAGNSVFRERRMMHKDGTIVEVEANVKMLPDGRMLAIARDITERKKIEKEKEHARYLLNERVKELTALYRVSQILQTEDKSIDEILKEIVTVLPSAWRFAEMAAARISLGDQEYKTPNFGPAVHKQCAEFATPDGKKGVVQVVYLEEKPVEDEDAFLVEERDLINMVADMVRVNLARRHEASAKKIMEQEILNQRVQAQKMITRAVLKAEERERNKIGQELHDNVNQILASIKLFLSMAKGKGLVVDDELLTRSTKLVDNVIEEIRILSKTHVTPLKHVNLKDLIQSLIDKVKETTTLKTNFNYNVNGQVIDDDLKLNIYRIIQEQINNIIKHADASDIDISVNTGKKFLEVSVTDNGRGFDTTKKWKGIGIANMINRVESFNGELVLDSSPGRGCGLKIRVPF